MKKLLALLPILVTGCVAPVRAGNVGPESIPCWFFRGEKLELQQTCISESHTMIMKGRSLFGLTMILTTWVILLPVCAASTQAIKARPEQIVQRQPNCNNPTTNLEIKECIRLRYQAADRRLNEVYQQLISKVSAEERSLLVEAQRGWIQLRDKNCEFEVYRNLGGTGYRGFLNECLERMTKQRTAELENYFKDR